MANEYRVDRVNTRSVPCGMNSIVYVGGSLKEAREAFESAQIGLTAWHKPNATYGVVLSRWVGAILTGHYDIINSRGVD